MPWCGLALALSPVKKHFWPLFLCPVSLFPPVFLDPPALPIPPLRLYPALRNLAKLHLHAVIPPHFQTQPSLLSLIRSASIRYPVPVQFLEDSVFVSFIFLGCSPDVQFLLMAQICAESVCKFHFPLWFELVESFPASLWVMRHSFLGCFGEAIINCNLSQLCVSSPGVWAFISVLWHLCGVIKH